MLSQANCVYDNIPQSGVCDDVMTLKHFPHCWDICAGMTTVDYLTKGQFWRKFLMSWGIIGWDNHHNDVIMSAMTSQITSLAIVYSSVYSGPDQRKHQRSASLAFVRGIHWWPVNSPHKGPVTRKYPFDHVIMLPGHIQHPPILQLDADIQCLWKDWMGPPRMSKCRRT